MPYINGPLPGQRSFYVINPRGPVPFALSSPLPPCDPLDPSKPTIVFFNCTCSSIASFSRQFEDLRLSGSFNLVGVDARGHGRTEWTEQGELQVEETADTLMDVLDQLGLDKFSLFGEGVSGGTAATWTTIKRPEKVVSLMLASPGYVQESPSNLEAIQSLPTYLCVNKDGEGDGSGTIPDEGLALMADYFIGGQARFKQARDELMEWFQIRYGTGHSSHDLMHILRAGERPGISDKLLATIKIPVLIVHGTEDKQVFPLPAAKEWVAKLTGGGVKLHSIANAPHQLSFTDYNIVNRMLKSFVLESHPQQPSPVVDNTLISQMAAL